MIAICREHAGNVKRWQDGQMALRWCAAGMVEAAKQFRRVNGSCTYQPFVQRWRLRPLAPSHPRARVRRWSKRPEGHRAATEVPRNSGHPPPPAYLLDSYNVHDNVICATTSHATGVVSDNGTNFATARSASAATPSRPPASCSWPMIAAAAVRL